MQGKARFYIMPLIMSVIALVCIAFPQYAEARSANKEKYASIVIDADTGLVLNHRHADSTRHPASLTKIMTIYMVFEALENGKISLNDRVRISRHAASMVPSKLGLPSGSSIRVKDAISALVTKSANDVAAALAEHIAGTESAFARRMTQKAHELGMRSTRFRNASGLHHRHQVSTARDMARLARAVLHDYPQYYRYFSTQRFTYRGKTYNNHNRLMRTYRGMDGIKTGYINASGFNLVASARQDGRRIIGVVFGGRTSKTRNAHMKTLMDNGFAKLRKLKQRGPVIAAIQKPPRKPFQEAPARVATVTTPSRAVASRPQSQVPEDLEEMLGQGDIEPDIARRLETGLLVMAVHTNQDKSLIGIGRFNRTAITPTPPAPTKAVERVRSSQFGRMPLPQRKPGMRGIQQNAVQMTVKQGDWAVQIGAFESRALTDEVIKRALSQLPEALNHAQGMIAPLRTGNGIVFRGRLASLNEAQARAACRVLGECLIIEPQ